MRSRSIPLLMLAVAGTIGCGEVIGPSIAPDGAAAPTASALAPDHGPLQGGNTVTITGSGFLSDAAGEARVVVDGVETDGVTVVSDTEISFEAPAGLEQGRIVDVTVFNQAGMVTLPLSYRYNLLPVVFAVSPDTGSSVGGTTVTITGHGFLEDEAGAATVTISGVDATTVSVVNDTTLTATIAATPDAPGFTELDVTVSNANGDDTLERVFRFTKRGLLGIARNGGTIYWMDTTDPAQVAAIGRVPGQMHDCEASDAGPIFCAFTDTDFSLGTLDPLEGTITRIGATNAGVTNIRIRSLAYAGATLYGYSNITTTLYSIDTTTGALTAVSGALGIGGQNSGMPGNIAARDATSMYIYDATTTQLRTVSITGVVTAGPVMTGGGPNPSIYSTVFDGTTLYIHDRTRALYTANPTTGVLTLVGSFPNDVHSLFETPASF